MSTWSARAVAAAVTTVLVMGVAGCGSQASDQEIAAALGAGSPTGAVAVPGAPVDTQAATGVAAGTNSGPAVTSDASTTGAAVAPGAATKADTVPAAAGKASGQNVAKTVAAPGNTAPGNSAPTVADKSEVRVGQVGAFSGVLGAVTSYGPKVLGAWAAYTNAHGGLNGHPVRIIVGDDQADPATAMTLTRRLVENDKILAMVGNVNIFGFPQIEKYTREKGIPLIGGDGVDPMWATSPNSFPTTTSILNQTIYGLKALLDAGGTKIGTMYCLEVSALCTYLNEGVKNSPEVGSKVSQTYQVSLVAPSYTSQCLRMKQDGIDVLWLGMDGPGAARAASDCAKQGFTPQILLLSLDATKETPAMPALAKALVPAGVFPTAAQGVAAIAQYRQVMATYAPTVGDGGVGAVAWTAGELLGLAGKNLSERPTSAEFYEALWKVKNETLGGLTPPLTFSKGKGPEVKRCIFIWGIAGSKWAAPNGAKPSC